MALSSLHASLLTREPPTGNNLKKPNINTAKCDSEAESFFHATLTVTVPYKWKRVEGGIGAIKNEVRNQSLS